ncbi:hypothetical protein Hanom_Chr04g00296461 [Helianthus anomalus]
MKQRERFFKLVVAEKAHLNENVIGARHLTTTLDGNIHRVLTNWNPNNAHLFKQMEARRKMFHFGNSI